MCGIAGLIDASGAALGPRIRAMTGRIRHRGPDAEGHWIEDGVALGHRRLSILDLSEAGAQPMVRGPLVLVFNGEIYNHPELRAELEAQGHRDWRGTSDTETLLTLIAARGLSAALDRACGMFALALWDRDAKRLALARDRMGEKPLLYAAAGGRVAFASELSALTAGLGTAPGLDPVSVREYLRRGYVPDDRAILQGVAKVPPGAIVTFEDGPRTEPYWRLRDVARPGPAPVDDAATEAVLRKVVASQALSDVPLGAFLSGGIDSSLVTALMRLHGPVRSFSIGFEEARFDEGAAAAAVAAHLGCDHTPFTLREADALAIARQMPGLYDEPFADSSQIPTALLARAARDHVTVALTGDGGDEVFGGYNRHIFGPGLWRALSRIPAPLRAPAGAVARLVHRVGGHDGSALRAALLRAGLPVTTMDKLGRLGEIAGAARDLNSLHDGLSSHLSDPGALMVDPPEGRREPLDIDPGLAPAEWMMVADSLRYLPGDILVKVDRAAMAASLETRAPLLDVRVVEHAWSLPMGARIDGRAGKAVLRRILARHVPPALTDRPKQGFAIPLDAWLRGGLRDWAGDLLLTGPGDPCGGLVRRDAVERLWADHQAGRANEGARLWSLAMLAGWLAAR